MIYRFQPVEEGAASIIGRQKISKKIYNAYRKEKMLNCKKGMLTVDIRYVPRKPEWFKAAVNPDKKNTSEVGDSVMVRYLENKPTVFEQISGE